MMLPVGSKVYHNGHGVGTIIAYNLSKPLGDDSLGGDMTAIAIQLGLGAAIVSSMYDGEKFPYIVQFDSGYKDVYAETDFSPLVVSD
jgi:hypothetical protein